MKPIKEITNAVIDLAIDNMYSETETWHDEDGGHSETTLSPKPELYTKLNQYFTEVYTDMLVMAIKNQFKSEKEEVIRNEL